jgi:hypothetical protein
MGVNSEKRVESSEERDVENERFSLLSLLVCGDDCNRQSLQVGNPHITTMPQAFHQGTNHDKNGYHPYGVHRFLLAMMLVWQPPSC